MPDEAYQRLPGYSAAIEALARNGHFEQRDQADAVFDAILAAGWTPPGSFVRAPAEDAGAIANGFTVAMTDCAPLYREAGWTPPGTEDQT